MILTHNRKAFSMITAVFVIIIMSAVGALVLNLSEKITKETTTQFQREQAMLLAKSYTEYTIMSVMANDRIGTNSCLQTINSDNVIRDEEDDGGFEVRVQLAYISNGSGELDACDAIRVLSDTATTVKSPLNLLIDVYVKYKDFDHHDPDNAPFITYHKRTLQKI